MKRTKKDLEETVKEKVSPMVEETMEKRLGVAIPQLESDITDQLLQSHLDIYIAFDKSFKEAKKLFKKEFLKRELEVHLGNISELAKVLKVDRRSVHRAIKRLEINVEDVRKSKEEKGDYYGGLIDKTIRSALEPYEEIIKPEKMELMYREVPRLSRNIVQILPHQELTWKEAEREFEKQFLGRALVENEGNVSKTAQKIEVRVETLYRKLKKLGLK